MASRAPTLLTLCLTVLLAGTVRADLVTIANASFEDPVNADGDFTVGWDTVTNWTGFPTTVIEMGVENPFSSRFAQTLDVIDDANADGHEYAYINTFAPGETGSFTSDVVGVIVPSTRYELTVSVGNGLDIDPSLYTIELLADSLVIASSSLDGSTITQGTFTPLTTTFTSSASGPIMGQQLQIRLVGTNITGLFQPIQAQFDNVRLNATSVPEPRAWLLAAFMGCLAVGPLWCRRHHPSQWAVAKA